VEAVVHRLIRYAIVKHDVTSNVPQIVDDYVYERKEAEDILRQYASNDFANYALYGLRKLNIKIRCTASRPCYAPLIRLDRHEYKWAD